MHKGISAVVALMVLFTLALGQEAGKPYSYTFKGGVGTCLLRDKPLDAIWSASIKLFMTQNIKGFTWNGPPVTPDKPSNTMWGGWVMGKGITKWACSISLLFEEKDGVVSIFATAHGKNVGKANGEKAERKYFDDLIAALYGQQ